MSDTSTSNKGNDSLTTIIRLNDEISELKKENETLKECLEFYGDRKNWNDNGYAVEIIRENYKGNYNCDNANNPAKETLDDLLKPLSVE